MTHADSGTKQKTCSKCGKSKTLDCFDAEKTGKDGLRCKCKVCRSEEHRQWYARNYERVKDRKNAQARKRYAERKALGLIGKRKWAEQNPKMDAYVKHKSKAKKRGVEFLLTFEEWRDWWGSDWDQRGRTKNKLVMGRYGDTGPYALGNIYKTTQEGNSVDRQRFKNQKMREV